MSESSTSLLTKDKSGGEEANTDDTPPSNHWYALPPDDVEKALTTDRNNGLTPSEAEKRLQHYGENTLTSAPRLFWLINSRV
jgi:magnesium-transporting ATPase (P-type)